MGREVDKLDDETERGLGGFGHSGRAEPLFDCLTLLEKRPMETPTLFELEVPAEHVTEDQTRLKVQKRVFAR